MGRVLGYGLGLIVLILVGGLAVAYFMLGSIVSSQASDALRTEVKVGGVALTMSSVSVKGLEIANIPDGELQPAFSSESIDVNASIGELMDQERTTVEKIEIVKPFMALEMFDKSGKDNNWSRMTAHLKGEETGEPAEGGESKPFLIKHLLITDLEVQLKGGPFGEEVSTIKIAKLEDFDITNESGAPTGAIMQAVTQLILQKAVRDIIANPTKFVGGTVEEAVKAPVKILESIIPGGDKE